MGGFGRTGRGGGATSAGVRASRRAPGPQVARGAARAASVQARGARRLLLRAQLLQLHRGGNEAHLAALLDQPPDPPVVVVLLLESASKY